MWNYLIGSVGRLESQDPRVHPETLGEFLTSGDMGSPRLLVAL